LSVKQKVLDHLNTALQHSVDATALLQSSAKASVDPSDAGYESHTGGTQDIVYDLQTKARAQKAELDADWEKERSAFEATIKDTIDAMDANKAAIEQLQGDIGTLKTELSTAKGELIQAQSTLTDDETYLHDLTERCAARANDWDQRSAMRRDELEALSTALEILENKVKSADEAANKRAAASFIQVAQSASAKQSTVARHSTRLLNRVVAAGQTKATLSSQVQLQNVQQMLGAEAKRLKSALLGSLVMKVAADPFAKVKELIQKLIERLVKEAEEEASKKGFCDQELGKARHARDSRLGSVDKITAELAGLEAKRDFLIREIEVLTQNLKDLDANLKEQTKLRSDEKAENLATLKEAQGGLAAVTDALNTLKTFYRKAARASSFIQYSPVDDDTAGAGFKGSYKGNQEGSKAILGMLQTIVSDFVRTIATTTKMEGDNAAAFTELDRSTKADIGGKTTKKELDEEDLATTKLKIEKGLEHMQENMNLLDEALKELEELKPACIDTGMSYKERVEKREDEMAALKKAMCMLDADGVEPDCK
jgi:chromosome segregation ATPase